MGKKSSGSDSQKDPGPWERGDRWEIEPVRRWMQAQDGVLNHALPSSGSASEVKANHPDPTCASRAKGSPAGSKAAEVCLFQPAHP